MRFVGYIFTALNQGHLYLCDAKKQQQTFRSRNDCITICHKACLHILHARLHAFCAQIIVVMNWDIKPLSVENKITNT